MRRLSTSRAPRCRLSICASQTPRRRLSTYYDSQSGRHVELPTGPQCHVGLEAVATDRVSAALAHLLKKDGSKQPARGLASVAQHAVVSDDRGVEALVNAGVVVCGGVWITVSDPAAGVAAVEAARAHDLRARALLLPTLCEDVHDLQLHAANLGDAGADAIVLSLHPSALGADGLREMVDAACEIDLVDVPMRARLGLRLTRAGGEALQLAKVAFDDLKLLHFYTCLGGKLGPRPSELLQALGVRPVNADFSSMFLGEHVPDAA